MMGTEFEVGSSGRTGCNAERAKVGKSTAAAEEESNAETVTAGGVTVVVLGQGQVRFESGCKAGDFLPGNSRTH